ncbi:hypothetical protein TB2_033683 [Malus domestica]
MVLKHAAKLKDFFPEAVNNLVKESWKLESSSLFHSEKSVLWVYGGHPIFLLLVEVLKSSFRFWNFASRFGQHEQDYLPTLGH